jgi:hypothetical protein
MSEFGRRQGDFGIFQIFQEEIQDRPKSSKKHEDVASGPSKKQLLGFPDVVKTIPVPFRRVRARRAVGP